VQVGGKGGRSHAYVGRESRREGLLGRLDEEAQFKETGVENVDWIQLIEDRCLRSVL
jgi:hypothetical protein